MSRYLWDSLITLPHHRHSAQWRPILALRRTFGIVVGFYTEVSPLEQTARSALTPAFKSQYLAKISQYPIQYTDINPVSSELRTQQIAVDNTCKAGIPAIHAEIDLMHGCIPAALWIPWKGLWVWVLLMCLARGLTDPASEFAPFFGDTCSRRKIL